MVSITALAGAASGLLDLLSGPALSLGGIDFDGFEVPERLPFGGQQQLTVHKLPGGARVIDAMGPDDRNIEWSGYFRGPMAVSRARQVDTLRNAGKVIDLTWADFSRRVVIQNFEVDYTKGGFLLPYKLACVVVPAKPAAAKPGLLASLKADIQSAIDSSGVGELAAQAQQYIGYAQKALPILGAVTGGSSTFVALSGALGTAGSAVGGVQAVAAGQLSGLATVAAASGGVFGSLSGLKDAAAASRTQSSAAETAAALLRASSNLSRVGT